MKTVAKKKYQNVLEKFVGRVEWKNYQQSVKGQVVRAAMGQEEI